VLVGINNETSTTAITIFETLSFRLESAISALLNPPLIGVVWHSLIGIA
jgi:hypothetical protein